MTNEISMTDTTNQTRTLIGSRLQAAREAMKLERKEAAKQLRLSEKVIDMMETDTYPDNLPITFIRGYIRSYGNLLQIPEYEIKAAIEPIKIEPKYQEPPITTKQPMTITSKNYFMQFFTSVIVLTMLGLVGAWWYNHSVTPSPIPTESQPINIANTLPTPTAQPVPQAPLTIATPAAAPTNAQPVQENVTATKPVTTKKPVANPPAYLNEQDETTRDTEE